MTREQLQKYLDNEKKKAERVLREDVCGKYARCIFCYRDGEFPCAAAYEMYAATELPPAEGFLPEPPLPRSTDGWGEGTDVLTRAARQTARERLRARPAPLRRPAGPIAPPKEKPVPVPSAEEPVPAAPVVPAEPVVPVEPVVTSAPEVSEVVPPAPALEPSPEPAAEASAPEPPAPSRPHLVSRGKVSGEKIVLMRFSRKRHAE